MARIQSPSPDVLLKKAANDIAKLAKPLQLAPDAKVPKNAQLDDLLALAKADLAAKGNKQPTRKQLEAAALEIVSKQLADHNQPVGQAGADKITPSEAKAAISGADPAVARILQQAYDWAVQQQAGQSTPVQTARDQQAHKDVAKAARPIADEVRETLPPEPRKFLARCGTHLSGTETRQFLDLCEKNGIPASEAMRQLVTGEGPVAGAISANPQQGQIGLTQESLMAFYDRVLARAPQQPNEKETQALNDLSEKISAFAQSTPLEAFDPQGPARGPQITQEIQDQARAALGGSRVLSKAKQNALPEGSTMAKAAKILREESDPPARITYDRLAQATAVMARQEEFKAKAEAACGKTDTLSDAQHKKLDGVMREAADQLREMYPDQPIGSAALGGMAARLDGSDRFPGVPNPSEKQAAQQTEAAKTSTGSPADSGLLVGKQLAEAYPKLSDQQREGLEQMASYMHEHGRPLTAEEMSHFLGAPLEVVQKFPPESMQDAAKQQRMVADLFAKEPDAKPDAAAVDGRSPVGSNPLGSPADGMLLAGDNPALGQTYPSLEQQGRPQLAALAKIEEIARTQNNGAPLTAAQLKEACESQGVRQPDELYDYAARTFQDPGGQQTFLGKAMEKNLLRQMYPNLTDRELDMLLMMKDPDQRAMQAQQMQMQKESFIAQMITNMAQMRQDMRKAVAQNMRA